MNCSGGAELEDLTVSKSDGHLVRAGRLKTVRRRQTAGRRLMPAEPQHAALFHAGTTDSQLPANTKLTGALVTRVITTNYFNRQTTDWHTQITKRNLEVTDFEITVDHQGDRRGGCLAKLIHSTQAYTIKTVQHQRGI